MPAKVENKIFCKPPGFRVFAALHPERQKRNIINKKLE
ncbi:uncharacterized protein METZ01_LOCUS38019 [marine metagenome]|uniref:Uncharacterized protein n=1 Tax=marine metagenome TaxID=408172 RepID=A0A381R0D8_9ZZZZ